MVVGASITVNNSRNEGNIDSGGQSQDTKVLKQILAELKKTNKQSMVANRKKESGFGGAGGARSIMRLLGGLTSGVGLAAGAAGYLGGLTGADAAYYNPNVAKDEFGNASSSFAKGRTETGQEFVFELDKKTGDILNVITLEEAERQGIVDKLGNITKGLDDQDTETQSILGELEKTRGAYEVNNLTVDNIIKNVDDYGLASAETLHWAKETSRAQKALAKKIAREANINLGSVTPTSEEYRRNSSLIDRGKTPVIQYINMTGSSQEAGNQNNQNIEEEILYSVDKSNVAKNIFWGNN